MKNQVVSSSNLLNSKPLSIVKWGLIALFTVALIAIIVSIYKAAKSGGNAIGNIIGDATISVQTGIDQNRVSYLRTIAFELWDKGVDLPFGLTSNSLRFARDYDEEMFIKAINTCINTKEAALLNEFYRQRAGENLSDAINASFSSEQKTKCKAIILSFLLN